MKITKETKKFLKTRALQKKCERQDENLRNILTLLKVVEPAPVYHVEDMGTNEYPSLTKFAKDHDYDYSWLLRLLRRENILTKVMGTHVFKDNYSVMRLAFYTIGRHNRYRCLDMYLTDMGIGFMERFIKEHPIKHRVRNQEK